MPVSEPDLISAAQRWAAADPDPRTRQELEALIQRRDLAELLVRMQPLEFGTAGLRGLVGAGPSRMNRAVVLRTTHGLGEYVIQRVLDARALPVVVGFDARLHSADFARNAVAALTGLGLPVRVFADAVPTPLVAYAAKQMAASAAVMITASHNPPEYNGYKVYAANAAQIVDPVDAQIAQRIALAPPADQIPQGTSVAGDPAGQVTSLRDGLFERYLAELELWRPAARRGSALRILYTPLHGVGWRYVARALRQAGYFNVEVVKEQAEPDGTFPTVRFPNPEESGTLALAMRQAAERQAELVLANDPDADRLAVCVPDSDGAWQQLTGDQVGILLADFLLSRASQTRRPLVLSSVVSSPMLDAVARHWGAHLERTLTGFKWICNAALALEAAGAGRFLFGYEEALGYAIPLVRDKDGISAAVLFADLAAQLRADGQSVLGRLEALYRQFGFWSSHAVSIVASSAEGLAQMSQSMERIRRSPPQGIGGRAIVRWHDYAKGAESRPRWRGAADLIEVELAGGSRILIRPSGTEPKLKIYVHIARLLRSDQSLREAQLEAQVEAMGLYQRVAELLDLG